MATRTKKTAKKRAAKAVTAITKVHESSLPEFVSQAGLLDTIGFAGRVGLRAVVSLPNRLLHGAWKSIGESYCIESQRRELLDG